MQASPPQLECTTRAHECAPHKITLFSPTSFSRIRQTASPSSTRGMLQLRPREKQRGRNTHSARRQTTPDDGDPARAANTGAAALAHHTSTRTRIAPTVAATAHAHTTPQSQRHYDKLPPCPHRTPPRHTHARRGHGHIRTRTHTHAHAAHTPRSTAPAPRAQRTQCNCEQGESGARGPSWRACLARSCARRAS